MKKREIPFFNYSQIFKSDAEQITEVIQEVLSRGAFILQKDVQEFERNLAEYLNVKYAVGVANCTDGLTLILRAVGVQPGDEIIFPSHTFVATAEAIYAVGGVPVPVDCGQDHLIDPKSIEASLTKKTRIIMPVQLNGRTCKMDAIQKIADRHGLTIVEDAAQGLGSKYKGRYAGTFGVAAAFSFYPAKSLGCFGDGGAIVTNDARIAEQIRLMRDHGRNEKGEIVIWGVNSRLDNLQAAILNFRLQSYDNVIQRRREIAARYHKNLRNLPLLTLPPAPNSDPDHFDAYQNYEIEAQDRDALKSFLREEGVGALIQWGGQPVHQLKKLGFSQNLPYTDKVFTRCLMLPMNPAVSDEDVDYVSQKIEEFYVRFHGYKAAR